MASGAQNNRSVQSLATLSLASTPHRTAAIRALSADYAQSLRVIRFQSGLLRDRRVCSAVETIRAYTRTDHLLFRVSLA
jgi:hypothetical protein